MIDARTEKQARKQFGRLIQDAEKLLEASPIHEGGTDFKTKLSNLINAAKSSSCLKQIELFVEYQAARDNDPKRGFREKGFAVNLLERLNPTKGIIADTGQHIAGADQDELQVWLAVQYLGFLRKKYMFLKVPKKEMEAKAR